MLLEIGAGLGVGYLALRNWAGKEADKDAAAKAAADTKAAADAKAAERARNRYLGQPGWSDAMAAAAMALEAAMSVPGLSQAQVAQYQAQLDALKAAALANANQAQVAASQAAATSAAMAAHEANATAAKAGHINRRLEYPRPDDRTVDGRGKAWALLRWADGCWELWHLPKEDGRWENGTFVTPTGGTIWRRGIDGQASTDPATLVNLPLTESGKCQRTTPR